ncbi:hypothetical protein D3C76_1504930 [compost metagenome]
MDRCSAHKRIANEARVEQTIRLTPGQSNHSTSAANCGPLLPCGNRTKPCSSSHGANPPHASKAPSSKVRPTRIPMIPPKPTNSSEGSAVNVRRSSWALGDQRGIVHMKVSTALTSPDSNAALSNTFKRVAASWPWL